MGDLREWDRILARMFFFFFFKSIVRKEKKEKMRENLFCMLFSASRRAQNLLLFHEVSDLVTGCRVEK